MTFIAEISKKVIFTFLLFINLVQPSKSDVFGNINRKNNYLEAKIGNLKTSNKINGQLLTQKNICLMIGPEGGFSNQEIELAKKHNIKQVTLGKSRLRSETAAIYGLSVIKSIIN